MTTILVLHGADHLPDMILGNGPAAKGAHGESHEPHGIVIRCNPVGAYLAADRAPVQDGPFAVFLTHTPMGSRMPPHGPCVPDRQLGQ